MPRESLAICVGKSTYARCGIIVNVTPIEPEWRGQDHAGNQQHDPPAGQDLRQRGDRPADFPQGRPRLCHQLRGQEREIPGPVRIDAAEGGLGESTRQRRGLLVASSHTGIGTVVASGRIRSKTGPHENHVVDLPSRVRMPCSTVLSMRSGTSRISNPDGVVVFEMNDAEIPARTGRSWRRTSWSANTSARRACRNAMKTAAAARCQRASRHRPGTLSAGSCHIGWPAAGDTGAKNTATSIRPTTHRHFMTSSPTCYCTRCAPPTSAVV